MSENNEPDIIPGHYTGVKNNTEASEQFNSTEEAEEVYQKAKQRLLQVNEWHNIAGKFTAEFHLTDNKGREVNRAAQKGDYFKINIPGPGPVNGDGYDWVQVEWLEETNKKHYQEIVMMVRPSANPTKDQKDIAHFFSNESCSCFMVKREYAIVTAGVYGRNEKPNTQAENLVDKARNTAIATGAVTGFSKLQWKSLVNAFIKRD